MRLSDQERAALKLVARKLGDLRDEVAFVGGAVAGVLLTDPLVPFARPTDDVDVIADVTGRVGYYALSERLRALGFAEDSSERAPLCRWIIDGLKVDVMPIDKSILGFSNRWYRGVLERATWHAIGDVAEDRIRVATAPDYLATKLESFENRGKGDFLHHDLEDVVSIVDGREALEDELRAATDDVRMFVASELRRLLGQRAFVDALPGYLPGDAGSQARVDELRKRLDRLAGLA